MHPRRFAVGLALALSALALSVAPAHAQGKGKDKHYAVSNDRAVTVTRNVLVRQGYDVVRIERVGATVVAQTGMIGPLSTILMGIVILGEPFTGWILAGTVLVLTGIWLLTKAR